MREFLIAWEGDFKHDSTHKGDGVKRDDEKLPSCQKNSTTISGSKRKRGIPDTNVNFGGIGFGDVVGSHSIIGSIKRGVIHGGGGELAMNRQSLSFSTAVAVE